jgi:hypothetical protein
MRRVFAISLAILIVIAARGVVAQDAEQAVSDRLLDILKDRQIISDKEYGELKDLAADMQQDRAETDRRLGDLDRSIADYLAKEGDAIGSSVTYTKGSGFRFASTDGLFSLNLGGLIDVEMSAVDRDRDEFPEYSKRDVTNIFLAEARWHFFGHAFDPNLTYFLEFATAYSSQSKSLDNRQVVTNGIHGISSDYCGESRGVYLLDAYVDWNICDWTTLRVGRFKVPFGWQRQVHKSDLAFGTRALPYRPTTGMNYRAWDYTDSNCCLRDRDDGIMFHDTIATPWFGDFLADMEVEYAVGVFDGAYAQYNSWLMPAWRVVLYPFGDLDENTYVEGDWRQSDDPMMGFGASYFYDQGPNPSRALASMWGLDFHMTWYGFSLTAEYMRCKFDERNYDAAYTRGWYVQAAYMALPNELEIMARYGSVSWPWHASAGSVVLDQSTEWSVGAAYYWEGHNLKTLIEFGRTEVEWDEGYGFSTTSTGYEDHETWFARVMFQLEW